MTFSTPPFQRSNFPDNGNKNAADESVMSGGECRWRAARKRWLAKCNNLS